MHLVLVCIFLHNSRITSTEIICKHTGQDIYGYALSNILCLPLPTCDVSHRKDRLFYVYER